MPPPPSSSASTLKPVAAGRPAEKQRDKAVAVLHRVSRHLHKINQGIGAGDPHNEAAASASSGSPFFTSLVAPQSPNGGAGANSSWLSESGSSLIAHSPNRASSVNSAGSGRKTLSASAIRRAPSATSVFSSLPHHETRIASNRGMYIRHRRLGVGSFGETWLCEWRPAETAKTQTTSASPRRMRSSSPSATRNNNSSSRSLSNSGGSINVVGSARDDAPDDEPPPSPAQLKAALIPPAVVSGLSCCRSVVVLTSKNTDIAPSIALPADRLFVLKIDAKQPADIAEAKKSGVLQASFVTSTFSAAAVIQHPQQPSREVVVFTPPPLRELDKKQQEEEDAESLSAVGRRLLQRTSSSSASELDLEKPNSSKSSPATSDNDTDNNPDTQFQAGLGASCQSAGSAASNGSAGNSRQGGVDVLKRKNTQHALRKHASTASRESTVLRDCAHPNIVGFVDEFEDTKNRYLVMEYVDGGDLREEVQRRVQQEQQAAVIQAKSSSPNNKHFSVTSAMFLWVQALCAVEYLHRHNIMHRDIKTANLLCSRKWRVLLADFGFGRCYEHDIDEMNATITAKGTPHYMAPEMFRRDPVSGKSDIWALGVVLFELLALQRPFEKRTNTTEVVASRVMEKPHLQVNNFRPPDMQVPPEVVALIDAMLQKEPAQRPTAKQLMRMPIVGAALDDYKERVSKTAESSGQPIDKILVAMLDEHIKLVRSDELSSPASRRRHAMLRRVQVAKRPPEENYDDDDDDNDTRGDQPAAAASPPSSIISGGRRRTEKRKRANQCPPDEALGHVIFCSMPAVAESTRRGDTNEE